MIYFLLEEQEKQDFCKIGYSFDLLTLQGRIPTLQTGNPHNLYLGTLVHGEQKIEGSLHRYFEAERKRGEWFETSKRIVRFMNASNHLRKTFEQIHFKKTGYVKRSMAVDGRCMPHAYDVLKFLEMDTPEPNWEITITRPDYWEKAHYSRLAG